MPKTVGLRERLDYRERIHFLYVGPTQQSGAASWEKTFPSDDTFILTAVEGGVDRYLGNSSDLQHHLRKLTVHVDVYGKPDLWTSPFDCITYTTEMVLDTRVRRLEALVEALMNPEGAEAEKRDAVDFDAGPMYVDHRRLKRPVLVPPRARLGVRVTWKGAIEWPLDVHVDLHGIYSHDVL